MFERWPPPAVLQLTSCWKERMVRDRVVHPERVHHARTNFPCLSVVRCRSGVRLFIHVSSRFYSHHTCAFTHTQSNALKHTPGRLDNLAQAVGYAWRRIDAPVVAALHGVCLGGGLQIALGADFRVATADCKISVLEAKWGIIPGEQDCTVKASISHSLTGWLVGWMGVTLRTLPVMHSCSVTIYESFFEMILFLILLCMR